MKKLNHLRRYLLDTKHLAIEPEDLLVYCRNGKVVSHYQRENDAGNDNFALSYEIHILLSDFSGEPQDLFYLVLNWMRKNHKLHDENAIRFDVDILNNETSDVVMVIPPVNQSVKVRKLESGVEINTCDCVDTDPIIIMNSPLELIANREVVND